MKPITDKLHEHKFKKRRDNNWVWEDPKFSVFKPGAAILFGIIGLIADESKGMAIAGLILGIIGIVFIIFILPMIILFGFLAFLGAFA